MKLILILRMSVTVLVLAPCVAFAKGGMEGGGGDPNVVEFLRLTQETCTWALKYQTEKFPNISKCQLVIDDLRSSLVEGKAARLIFTDLPLFDENGISKVALFNRKELSIRIHRPLWRALVTKDKYVTASIELAGLSGESHRYEFGEVVAKEYGSYFEREAFPTFECMYGPPGGPQKSQAIPFSSIDLEAYNKEIREISIDPNASCGICIAGKAIVIQNNLQNGNSLKIEREYFLSRANQIHVQILKSNGLVSSVMSFDVTSASIKMELLEGRLEFSCEKVRR